MVEEKENQKNWEKEFDEQFQVLGDEQYPFKAIPQKLKEEIKKFIHQLLEKEKERWKEEEKEKEEKGKDNIAQFFWGKPFNSLSEKEKFPILLLIERIKKDEENSE